jgi:hypothetical protein
MGRLAALMVIGLPFISVGFECGLPFVNRPLGAIDPTA